jgi:hypothetical protein
MAGFCFSPFSLINEISAVQPNRVGIKVWFNIDRLLTRRIP